VFFGAHRPYQVLVWKPGMPASSMVGTSGRDGERFVEVTASARSRPEAMKGMAEGMESNIIWIWPPIRSVRAGELPL
jgi:hypothetical protein